MKFIEKLDFNIDLGQAQQDLETILSIQPWPERILVNEVTYPANQLGLTYRQGSSIPWIDAAGSLVDPKTGTVFGKESDFTEFNSSVPKYTKSILSQLAEQQNTKFGRIRYMRLMPKTGLTIHHDLEKRYHLALETNPFALFGEYISCPVNNTYFAGVNLCAFPVCAFSLSSQNAHARPFPSTIPFVNKGLSLPHGV